MPDEWDILDQAALKSMIKRNGRASVLQGLGEAPSAGERAARLRQFAVRGDIAQLRDETRQFHDWAEAHALKRVTNALIELQRCAELKARGQAILQAQALTRFIGGIVDDDVRTLMRAVDAA